MSTKKAKSGSNTAAKQRKIPKGKPFVKGDPRINRNGRPKSFDELRKLFQAIAHEEIELDKKKLTRAQAIGIIMASDPKQMKDFLEFAFGKVPQKVEGNGPNGEIEIVTKRVGVDMDKL